MTQSFSFKETLDVQAKLYRAGGADSQDVMDWAASFLPPDATLVFTPAGNLQIVNGDFVLVVNDNQYVYVDEDGLHAVDRSAFELVAKKNI
jgi:hypothetical protein